VINSLFINNTAPYGNSISSFPSKLRIENSSKVYLFGAGQVFSEKIKVELLDFDDQIVNNINTNSIKI